CVLCRSRPADCPILFPYTTLFRSDCLPLPLVVTRTACVPRTNCEESLTSADWVPAPPALQPCDFWNCSDQVARRCLGPRPEGARSEEHTSELQSRENLVCRLLRDK